MIVDEAHRSIYGVWRGVKQTFAREIVEDLTAALAEFEAVAAALEAGANGTSDT